MLATELAPPPLTNRGVYPPSEGVHRALTVPGLEHRFDAYRATVDAALEAVLVRLEQGLAAAGVPVKRLPGATPSKGYARHDVLADLANVVVANVFSGGHNVRPNVEAKGHRSQAVAEVLRAYFTHHPSRVDPKVDVTASGLFDWARAFAPGFASRHGLQPPKEWRNNDPDQGDTITLGARTSQFYLRIYQPGLKRAREEGRTGDQITQGERDAVRIELEFKPQKRRAKVAAATLAPSEMWALSPWVAAFATEVFAMNVQPISIAERRQSNRNRALAVMATQYRAHLDDLLRECDGDLTLFGATIADLAGLDRA